MVGFGIFLLIVGLLINLIASIAILITAFQESILWGLACLLIPLAALVFIALHWHETKKPFVWSLVSLVPVALGFAMMSKPKPAAATQPVAETTRPRPTSTRLSYDPNSVDVIPTHDTTTVATTTTTATPTQQASMIQVSSKIEQVYAENTTKLFYAENCTTRPANAYRISKKLAMSQGFTEGTCPR